MLKYCFTVQLTCALVCHHGSPGQNEVSLSRKQDGEASVGEYKVSEDTGFDVLETGGGYGVDVERYLVGEE